MVVCNSCKYCCRSDVVGGGGGISVSKETKKKVEYRSVAFISDQRTKQLNIGKAYVVAAAC